MISAINDKIIANVKSTGDLAGKELRGGSYLEVPPQEKAVPQEVLDYAKKNEIIIRDTNGRIYQ